jgi:hypothetical protein
MYNIPHSPTRFSIHNKISSPTAGVSKSAMIEAVEEYKEDDPLNITT